MHTSEPRIRKSRRRLIVAAVTLVLVASTLSVRPGGRVDAAAAAPAMSGEEQTLLRLVNEERVKHGLPALVHDSTLAATAREWSATMRSTGLRHDSTANIAHMLSRVEPRWASWGENVGRSNSPQAVHNLFMGSAQHRSNILGPKFNRVGIGVVRSGGDIWVTVRFLQGPPITGPTGLSCSARPITWATAADLNGDGADDVVVDRADLTCDQAYLGSTSGRFRAQTVAIGGSYTPVTGDFDGDGRDNVFFYAPGPARDHLGKWTGTTFDTIFVPVNGHYRPYAGDFDGDGRDDILWYAPGPAPDSIWYGTSRHGHFDSRPLVVNGHYEVVVTDLDGDGRDDVLWYGPGAQPDYVHYSTGRGRHVSVAVTINGRYQPVAGDFDGDGRGDVLWYGPGAAADHVWYGHGRRGSFQSRPITINGNYRPVAGDFNGDGRSDVIWLRADAVGSPMWMGHSARGSFTTSTMRL